jgi:hypothetical protein
MEPPADRPAPIKLIVEIVDADSGRAYDLALAPFVAAI